MGSLYAWAIHPRAGLNDPCGSTQNILGFCCWGQRRKKKEQKRKLKGGQFVLEFYTFCVVIVCVSIPHISELKEQRGWGIKGSSPKGKESPARHNTLNPCTPWISHQSTLQLIDWIHKPLPGNNHRFLSDSVFQHSGWEGFETEKFQFPGRRAEDVTLQVARVRIPSQCSDSRLGLQQAGVSMRNSGCSPLDKWEKSRRASHPTHRPEGGLLAFTGKACRE